MRIVLFLAAFAATPLAAQTRVPLPPAHSTFEEGFTHVLAVVELRDGRVMLTDRKTKTPYLFKWDDGVAEPFGQVGRGPADFGQPRLMFHVQGDSVLIEDVSNRAYRVFDGRRIGERLNRRTTWPLGSRWLSGGDRTGQYLIAVPHSPGVKRRTGIIGERRQARAEWLLLGRDGSTRLDTISSLAGAFRAETIVKRPLGTSGALKNRVIDWHHTSLLTTNDQARLFPDGWIAIARKSPYRVEWRAPDGRWIRGAPVPDPPIKVTEAERVFAMYQESTSGQLELFQTREFPNWPTELPPFPLDALFMLDNGHLLVRRTPSARDHIEQLDVFDRTGRRVAIWSLPRDHRLVGVSAKWLYAVWRDGDDLERLKRYSHSR